MKRRPLLVLLALGSVALAADEPRVPPRTPPTPEITADEWLSRAAFLASDELAGRESGTEGGRRAEAYVAAEFARMGLEPLGPEGSFFQPVPLPSRNPDPEGTWVALPAADGSAAPIGDVPDAMPFAFSAEGEVTGELAFAGFGLTDPANEYDDYVGLDAKDKVVLVLRHGPAETEPDSPWSPRGPKARQAMAIMAFSAKASRAAAAGAAAVLIVNDYNHDKDELPVTVRGGTSKIPVLAISRSVADALLEGTGTTLRELQAAIDGDRKPRSRVVSGRSVTVRAAVEDQTARNVVAVLRGTDETLRHEAVVLCAHLDHVGMGWFGSLAGGGEIHNGADDNASGTAALLEAAEWIATQPAPRRSIVLAAWCGEEKGLVGSRHFVKEPLWPIADTVACINLDMVGRYRTGGEKDEGLMVGGAPTGSSFTELVESITGETGVEMTHSWDAWQQSDHYAFYAADVPALFLTTGLHAEYHRPADDWWLLAADGAAQVTRVAARLTLALASADTRPTFVARPKPPARPVLGVRLENDPERKGALMALVFPGMGAAEAGMQVGDLVVEWNGRPVDSGAVLGGMIGEHAPGDIVKAVVLRGDERLTLEIKLSGR